MIAWLTEGWYCPPTQGSTLISTGGAEGGVPEVPILKPLAPCIEASALVPSMLTRVPQLDPSVPSTETVKPETKTTVLKPETDAGDDEGDC